MAWNKDTNITSKKLKLSESISDKVIIKKITTLINMYVYRFSKVRGFRAKSTVNSFISIVFSSMIKIYTNSNVAIKTTIKILTKSKIKIDSNVNLNTLFYFKKKTKGSIDSEVDLEFSSDGIEEGVNFVLNKTILPEPSSIETLTTVDLLGYFYYKLYTHDPQTLGSLDNISVISNFSEALSINGEELSINGEIISVGGEIISGATLEELDRIRII